MGHIDDGIPLEKRVPWWGWVLIECGLFGGLYLLWLVTHGW